MTKVADEQLAALHSKYQITNFHDSLDDTVSDLALELKQLLLNYGKYRLSVGVMPDSVAALSQAQEKRLRGSFGTGFLGAEKTPVCYLKQPIAFVKEWIDGRVSRSESVKLSHKARQLVESLTVVPLTAPASIYRSRDDTNREKFKALVVQSDFVGSSDGGVVQSTDDESAKVSFF